MPGVRIHHPELRGATMVVELPDRPYPVPFLCSTCEAVHSNKAVHLRFDALGDCTVAEESWDILAPYLAGIVTVGKKIPEPEPMVLGLGGQREAFNVVMQELS